jgi:hypothetical protein
MDVLRMENMASMATNILMVNMAVMDKRVKRAKMADMVGTAETAIGGKEGMAETGEMRIKMRQVADLMPGFHI